MNGWGARFRTLSDRHGSTAIVIVAALILFGAVFGAALPQLGGQFLGIEYVDHYGTQWFYWFAELSVRNWESPGHSNLFFYPWGKDVFGHTGANVLDAYLAIPFRLTFGPVLGYNLFVLCGLALGAWAFSRLAREFTDDRLAIWLGALLLTFTPFILTEAKEGRPTQALLALPIFFVLFVWRSGVHRGFKAPVLAGLMLALCGFQYWYYAFFGGLVCAAHGCWRLYAPAPDSGGRWLTLARHCAIAGVALLLTLPMAWPLFMAHGAEDEQVPGLLVAEEWSLHESPPVTAEGTSIAIRMWQPLTRYSGSYVWDPMGDERFLKRAHWVPLLLWLSVFIWLWRPGRLERGPVIAMVVISMMMATGPLLIAGETTLPNVFYIYLSKALPFLRRLWWPERAFVFVAILFSLTVVVNLDSLRQLGRRWQRAGGLLVVILWTLGLALNKHVPFGMWDATVPAGYRCLASGAEGALIELPYAWTQAHLYYQTTHGRPILGGMIENNPVFTPDESVVFRNDNTFVRSLIQQTDLSLETPQWNQRDMDEVEELGYRFIVIQKDAFGVSKQDRSLKDNIYKKRLRHMRGRVRKMAGAPVYDDARISIYSPWGEPCPCDLDVLEPDDEIIGCSEISAAELVIAQDKNLVLNRILPAPD